MSSEKGMRFWLPSYVNVRGFPPYRSEDPFEAVRKTGKPSTVATVIFENCPDEGSPPVAIKGEKYITDAEIARHLMFVSKNGMLRFNAQDAVDLGFVSAEEMRQRGYNVSAPSKEEGIPGPEAPDPEPGETLVGEKPKKKRGRKKKKLKVDPTATKDELIKFAGKNKLVVDVTASKETLLKDIKKAIREKEKE